MTRTVVFTSLLERDLHLGNSSCLPLASNGRNLLPLVIQPNLGSRLESCNFVLWSSFGFPSPVSFEPNPEHLLWHGLWGRGNTERLREPQPTQVYQKREQTTARPNLWTVLLPASDLNPPYLTINGCHGASSCERSESRRRTIAVTGGCQPPESQRESSERRSACP